VEVALRPATAADEPFLHRVFASTRSGELDATGWDDEAKQGFLRMQYDLQRVAHRAAHPAASLSVVVVDGRDGGRLYVDRSAAAVEVIDIALLREHRGYGVGSEVIQGLLAEGCPVRARLPRGSRAQSLFERLGFRVVGEGDASLELEWTPRPEPPEAAR
jgi:ribosomal protein S18 acetylase RimI-like enzyme